ncbi:MAG: 4Fe-4S dicluster domain-containing protein [Thermodesulfobacteriota bacterium]
MSTPPASLAATGFIVAACRGTEGCENRALDPGDLPQRLAAGLEAMGFGAGLARLLGRPPKRHELFAVSLSCCPNACSRPQIADVGLIAAQRPKADPAQCTRCWACQDACREQAVVLLPSGQLDAIDEAACLACGACIAACPSGALSPGRSGWRVQLGGRLGRHPRLAEELPGLHSADQAVEFALRAARYLLEHARPGQRLGDLAAKVGARAVAGLKPGGKPGGKS